MPGRLTVLSASPAPLALVSLGRARIPYPFPLTMSTDFRVPASVLEEERGDELLMWDVIDRADEHVILYDDRPEEVARSMAQLTPGQRALLALRWCVGEVYNGGFDQFFTNSAGVLAQEALDGAHRIGAHQTADLLVRAYSIFPDGVPPLDRHGREDFLHTLSHDERDNHWDGLDSEFYELMESELYPRAAEYVRQHPAEFFLPS